MTAKTTAWRTVQAEALDRMDPAERRAYDLAASETDRALRMAELFYEARTAAGLSQVELARRMGTRQSTISQIEGAGQVPTVAMLERLAAAVGRRLRLELDDLAS